MSIIHANQAMLVTMWIVLILIGLNIVINLVTALRGSANFDDLSAKVTRPVLLDVLPLVLLALLTTIDGTHILVMIWYYVAAALIAIKSLMSLGNTMKR